jgi:hypothetical protein
MIGGKDTRPYITLTNEIFRHPKMKRLKNPWARLYVIELWTYCNQYMTDGWIDREVLHEKGDDIAEELIAAGWVDGPDAEGMFYMHSYLEHQKSKAEIEGLRAARRESSEWGNHTRWHIGKSIVEASCAYCQGVKEPPKKSRGRSVK